jgi:hypothetical protein
MMYQVAGAELVVAEEMRRLPSSRRAARPWIPDDLRCDGVVKVVSALGLLVVFLLTSGVAVVSEAPPERW